jgi:hypothetical protein
MQFPKYGLMYATCLVAISASQLSALTIQDASAVIFFGNRTYEVNFRVDQNFGFSASSSSGDGGFGFLQTNLIFDPVNNNFTTNGALEVSLSDLSLFCPSGCGSGSVGFTLNLIFEGSTSPILNSELSATGFGPARRVRGSIGSTTPIVGSLTSPPLQFSQEPVVPNSSFSFGPFTANNQTYLSGVTVSVLADLANPPGIQFAGDFDVFSIARNSSGFRARLEESSGALPVGPIDPGPAEIPEPASFFLAGSALLAGRLLLRR